MKNILGFLIVASQWLVKSSKDKTKFSATIKGSAYYLLVMAIAGAIGVNGLEEGADSLVDLLVAIGQVITAVYAVYGAVRKIDLTARGRNSVLR